MTTAFVCLFYSFAIDENHLFSICFKNIYPKTVASAYEPNNIMNLSKQKL